MTQVQPQDAAGTADPSSAANEDALREGNIAIVAEYIAAINAWDFGRMGELLSDDALFEMPYAPAPFARSVRGRENVIASVEQLPPLIETENLHDLWTETLAGDPGELISTYKSDMELLPQRTPYRNRYIARWTVRDGKVTYFAEYYDGIPLVEAMGGSVEVPS